MNLRIFSPKSPVKCFGRSIFGSGFSLFLKCGQENILIKMKIIHLIDYYQPQVGYQEYFLAREHAKAGHKTYVITSDKYFPFEDYENTYKVILGNRKTWTGERIEDGINIIRLNCVELPNTNLIFLYGLKKTISKINPDLIICHGVYSITSFLISIYKKDLGFKLIYDNHAAAFNTDFNRTVLRKIYHGFYQRFFSGSIKKNADKIFAVGEAEQDFISHDLDLPKKRIPLIRLGVDTDLFRFSEQARNNIRSNLKFSKEDKVIIFTGKITPNKDVHILIQALEKFNEKKFVLLLIGNGPEDYINKIKNLAKITRLIHMPFVKNNDLPKFFNASDIAVYPGDYTISIHEAIACKLPVVLPRWYGSEYLDTSVGIIRFQKNDINDLFQKIKHLAYNDDLIQSFGKLNSKFAKIKLDWGKISQQVIKLGFGQNL